MNLKSIFHQYKHILFIIYLPIYMKCFLWLEARNDISFTNIHCFVDDWIPFQELFTIPYLLWFVYVAVVLIYLFFQKEHLEDYYRCVITLILGMSTCLFIYFIFPNEQNMRPDLNTLGRHNIFTEIIQIIYASDTNTNVLPSIHVYNAVTIHVAFATSYGYKNRRGWRMASLILCALICLSTMFLKQHSLLDVITAFLLYFLYAYLVYRRIPKWRKRKATAKQSHSI